MQLELRRTAPGELPALHRAAAGWFAGHGYPVEAVRHAQAAGDWSLAARLLSDTWLSLALDGQQDTAHELLAGFPGGVAAGDPELIALVTADELNRGSLAEAEGHLARAASELGSVPAQQRGRFQATLGILRLFLGRQRGDVPAVAEEAQRLLAPVEAADAADPGLGGERRAPRGLLELARGRNEEALSAVQAAERLAGTLVTPHTFVPMIPATMLPALVRLGQTERAEAALAGLNSRERASAEMRAALASLRLAQRDPQAATAALAPVIDGSVRPGLPAIVVVALLLEAMARDALGDPDAAGAAVSAEAVTVLTPRELDVLKLVAQGLSNADIARRLVLSDHTVHRHLANILRKLNLSSRAAAAAWGVRTGLV